MNTDDSSRQHWSERCPLSRGEDLGVIVGILLLVHGIIGVTLGHDLLEWELALGPEWITFSAFAGSVPMAIALAVAPQLRRLPPRRAIVILIVSAALHLLWGWMMLPSIPLSRFRDPSIRIPLACCLGSVVLSALWQLRAMLRRMPQDPRGFPVSSVGDAKQEPPMNFGDHG
jgi:hypothetical protein